MLYLYRDPLVSGEEVQLAALKHMEKSRQSEICPTITFNDMWPINWHDQIE